MFHVLRYIYEVHREQSFSRAAQKLYLSQPSLSLAIKRYESQIGVQIFDRSSAPVKLTDVGAVLIDYIQRILDAERDMQAYLEDYHALQAGKLTIGAAHMFSSYLLPRLIEPFLHEYSNISVNILESDFLSLQEMTLNGEVDFLIESHDFDRESFEVYPLFEEQILLAVSAVDPVNAKNGGAALSALDVLHNRHLDDTWPAIDLSQFSSHPFLLLEKGHDMNSRGMQFCRDSGFEPHVFMFLNQLTTACNFAAQNLGVAFISDMMVKLGASGKSLVYYKLPGANARRGVNMVHKKNRYVSKVSYAFIASVTELSRNDISRICAPDR